MGCAKSALSTLAITIPLCHGILGLLLVRHLLSLPQALMRHPAAFQAHYYRRLQIEICNPSVIFVSLPVEHEPCGFARANNTPKSISYSCIHLLDNI
ncbi:hypothetical protein F5Y07DRAFT_363537 [Xylaria sp. FL0933]|nr:hypothetical protein F5Y07DRAFT_363537 [Xylaria sp. FL0933]